MDMFTNGDLKPSDDPEMLDPLKSERSVTLRETKDTFIDAAVIA